MADSIPDELITEILARLPVVSLLRFTSVCKSWCSLITSPSFVTKHLNHTKRHANDKFLFRQFSCIDKKLHYLLCRDAKNFGDEYSDLEIPFPFRDQLRKLRIVGSCNGLLCLSNHWLSNNPVTFLWNPSIRKSVALPMPSKPLGRPRYAFGFGAHPTTLECKVVRLAYESQSLGEYVYNLPPKVELYTQGTGLWRCISSAAPLYCIVIARHQAFVNGSVHWLAHYPRVADDGFRNLIALFSMDSEMFSEMMLPPTLANQHPSMSIEVFGESLAILSREMGKGSCCMWVMKDYGVAESWSKLFYINPPRVVRALRFRKNGEVLLATVNNGLLSYDPETRTCTNARIMENSHSLSINTFMETLVW